MIKTLVVRGWSRHAALFGGAAALVYVMTNRWWAGEWQGGVQAVTNSLVLLAPGVIFAAAADARALMPRSTSSWLNSTGDARGRLASLLLAVWIPPAVAVTVLLLNIGAVNLGLSTFHFPGVVLIQPFAWVLAFASLGVLAGRYLPLIAVAPISLLLGFVLPVVLAGTPDTRAAMLTPVDDGAVSAPLFLRPEVVGIQIGLCVLVAIAFMAFAFDRGRWHSAGARVWVVLALLVLVFVGFHVGPERRYEASNAAGPRECATQADVEICVWPDHRRLLAPGLEAASTLSKALPAAIEGTPHGFVERGLAAPSGWATFTTGTAEASVPEMAFVMSGEVLSRAFCGDGEHVVPSEAVAQRRMWLMHRMDLLGDRDIPTGLREVLALPEPQQQAWWARATQNGAVSCAVD